MAASIRNSVEAMDDKTDQPLYWEPSLAFLKYAIAFILAGSIVFAIVMLVFAPNQAARVLSVPALMLIAGSAWFLLARGKIKATVLLLGAGVWVYVTAVSIFFGGVNGTSVFIYPLIILLTGWLVSTRVAAAIALLTVAVTGALVLAEMSGVLPASPPTPPAARWVIQSFIFLISAVLIAQIVRAYRNRLQELRDLGGELAHRSTELQAREADLNRAQAIAHVGSWEYNIARDVMHLSKETCRIFGVPHGVKGNYSIYVSRVHPEDREALESAWRTAMRGGPAFDNTHRILVGDTVRWVRQRAELELGPNGTALRSVGTTLDVTALKQAEAVLKEKLEQLSQNELRLQRAMDATSDGLWEWDITSGKGYFSPAYYRMLGYEEGAFDPAAQSWIDLIHPEDRERVLAANQECIDNRTESFSVEYRMRAKDGGWRWILGRGRAATRDDFGKASFMVGTHVDISERKASEAERTRLESQLRESQKMEALGTLAGGVAHDFNNVLAMILGNAALARKDLEAGHPALESLNEIDKAGRRAKDLVQQILAFARRQTVERRPTSLTLAIVETARLLRASLVSNVRLNVKCSPDAPVVLADATQINQVLVNLCSNALHAVKQQKDRAGLIELELEDYTLDRPRNDMQPGRYACLTVRDNGSGMDEETRSRIFEPFFTTKQREEGSGLGLSVVQGIVKQHAATMEVSSRPGEGTEFRIYFPATDVPVQPAAVPPAGDAVMQGGGKHVLYVDDEEAIVFLMKRLLERQGFRVSGYTDPVEALAAARRSPEQFDLAVTDYNMPRMSGLDVARHLGQIRPDLPVLMASGYITEELRTKAPAAGIRELIYKPNTADDLCEAVARYAREQHKNNYPV